jgi:outer membrane protein assembly factor BamB
MALRLVGMVFCLLASALAGCGGGGGNDGGTAGHAPAASAVQDGKDWLRLAPAAQTVTQYEGESVPVKLSITPSHPLDRTYQFIVFETGNLLTEDGTVTEVSPSVWLAELHTDKDKLAGTRTTMIEIRACEDDPMVCAKPMPGSPWKVPVTVQVKSRAEAAARLTLSTPAIAVSTDADEAATFGFEAQLNQELISHPVNIGVVDPARLTEVPKDDVWFSGDGHYVFKLWTSKPGQRPAGTYTSNLELRMCEDDIQICAHPVPGSPWIVPLTLTLKPTVNLTPLQAIPGLGAWATYGGNAAHTGFVNARFDPAAFVRRWEFAGVTDLNNGGAATAIDNGKAFILRHRTDGHWTLLALLEDTGKPAWQADLGVLSEVDTPATANGRVYVTSAGIGSSYLFVYDQASGTQLQRLPMKASDGRSAPTPFGTDVYTIDGYGDGVVRYDDRLGKLAWNAPLRMEGGATAATDGRYAYAYSMQDHVFTAIDVADGSLAFTVQPPVPGSTYDAAAQVLLTDTKQAIVLGDELMAFDLAGRARTWTAPAFPYGQAAYANGVVYAFGRSGRQLEARAAATGALLWSSPVLGDGNFYDVIVTANLAFVSSTDRTLAIDLNTHQIVWTYTHGGNLAISPRGVLYIQAFNTGALYAVNLR